MNSWVHVGEPLSWNRQIANESGSDATSDVQSTVDWSPTVGVEGFKESSREVTGVRHSRDRNKGMMSWK